MGTLRPVSHQDIDATPVPRAVASTSLSILLWTVVVAAVWGSLYLPAVPVQASGALGVLGLAGAAAFVARIVAKAPVKFGRALWQLVSQLSPTALLMATFPLIIGEIIAIGQVMAILAVSVAVPWISAATTMPVYGHLTDVDRSDEPAFYRAFMRCLTPLLMWSIVPIGGFALVIVALLGWRPELIGLFLVGVTTNVLFAHLLVPAQETNRFGVVALSWLCYATALFVAPTLWYLVPLAGCLPALLLLRRAWASMLKPDTVDASSVARDVGYGLLYGSVLWADKFLFIILNHGGFDIVLLYVALIPMVVAQSAYFASQYQEFRAVMDGLRSMVQHRPIRTLSRDSTLAHRQCEAVTSRTIAVAGLTAVGMLLLSPAFGVAPTMLQLALFTAPIWFLAATVMAFQLAQVTGRKDAVALYAVHLAVSCVAIAALPPTLALLAIIVADALLVWYAERTLKAAFTTFGYELFWKKALAW